MRKDRFIIHRNDGITGIFTADRLNEKFNKKKKEYDKAYWKVQQSGEGRWLSLVVAAVWIFNMSLLDGWIKYVAAIAVPLSVGYAVNTWQAHLNRDKIKKEFEERDFTQEMTNEMFH